MFRIVKSLLVPLAVSIGAGACVPAVAQAGEFSVEIGHYGHRLPDDGWGDYRRDRGWQHRHDRRFDRRWDEPQATSCSPRRALFKARDLGLRGARIRHEGWRSITVSGWKWGQPVAVRFARAPSCPVIAW